MSAARRLDDAAPRAKSLAFGDSRLRGEARRVARTESRFALRRIAHETGVTVGEIAQALGVDERNAARALSGEKPIDIGDLELIAKQSPRARRFVERVLYAIWASVDASE